LLGAIYGKLLILVVNLLQISQKNVHIDLKISNADALVSLFDFFSRAAALSMGTDTGASFNTSK
jgi:hypothetical protein